MSTVCSVLSISSATAVGECCCMPRARPKLKLKVISHAFRLLFLRLARSTNYFELEHLLSLQFFTGKVSQCILQLNAPFPSWHLCPYSSLKRFINNEIDFSNSSNCQHLFTLYTQERKKKVDRKFIVTNDESKARPGRT